VKVRRGLLVTLLVWVTLDLALPGVPGAFVFEPGDSVESLQRLRSDGAAGAVVLRALARDPFLVWQPQPAVTDRPAPVSEAGLREDRVVSRLARATLAPAPPSDDAH
jgi:hypothetical protein